MGTWSKARPIHIRAISMDVTGTLVSFRGSLAEHYLGSAAQCGVKLPAHVETTIETAFAQAYRETNESTYISSQRAERVLQLRHQCAPEECVLTHLCLQSL